MLKSIWVYDYNYSAWYYLTDDGRFLRNGWYKDYYLKADGKMAHDEWIFDKNYNAWYYLKSNGRYARSEWVDGYYLTADGKMSDGKVYRN